MSPLKLMYLGVVLIGMTILVFGTWTGLKIYMCSVCVTIGIALIFTGIMTIGEPDRIAIIKKWEWW